MAYIQVFMSTGSKEDAAHISRTLVEKRLAACVQVIGPIASAYWWNDQVETAEEWLCLVKTHQRVYDELEQVVKEIHPYDTPEILALPITAGNQDYLSWLNNELKKP
jgi:periplasmic divalent cation tolerance protein